MLLYDIDVNKGGITSVMLSRSAELTKRFNYDVDLISLDYKDNYDEIQDKLRKDGRLSKKVNILNIHNYYEQLNTTGVVTEKQRKYYRTASFLMEKGFSVQDNDYKDKKYARYFRDGLYIKYKKWSKSGLISHVDYFNENRVRVFREVFHKEGYISRKIYFDFVSNEPSQDLYYTKDGFCYLNKWYNHKNGNIQRIYLFNKFTNQVKEFKNNKEFHVYWLNELCREQLEKPVLICDGVGSAPKVLSMHSEVAYRIYSIHTNHLDSPYEYGSPIKQDHVTLLQNVEQVDALIVLTESQKKDILKQFGDSGNVHVIPNFITPIRNFNVNRVPNLVTMISRYHPEKAIDEAIQAFSYVIKEIPDAKLEIYGHGEDRKRLIGIIQSLGLENNVYLKGYTSKVGEVLGKTNVTILTSQFEGLNVASLESMFCEVPVISYDVNYGMRDIIKDGQTGFLVPKGDRVALSAKIIELLRNPELGLKMGRAAKEFVDSNFSVELVIRKWIELFNQLRKET
jgi:glycosyltransferase involved in cell wall biosynthesis